MLAENKRLREKTISRRVKFNFARVGESSIELNSDTNINKPFMGGLEAHPTSKFILCGTGILPVLENASINIDRVKLWKNIQA